MHNHSKPFKHTLCALFLLVFVNMHVFADEKPNIAVLDFRGDATVNDDQLSFIASKISQEFSNTRKYRVLDRSRIDVILREQGFQESGACDTEGCQVEIGQMLGVEYLVAGKLVRFGPTYILSLEYVDVGSGEIVAATDVQQEGQLHVIVQDISRTAVSKLSNKILGHPTAQTTIVQKPVSAENQSSSADADLSGAIPGGAKPAMLSGKRKVALALFAGSLGAGAGGYVFNSQGEAAIDDYDSARSAQDPQALRTAEDEVNTKEAYRNISYGSSGLFALAGLVLWFWPEGN